MTRAAWVAVASVALSVVVLDQISKTWALSALADRMVPLVGSLQLVLTYNRGVAFGLAPGAAPVLVLAALFLAGLALFGRRVDLELSRRLVVGIGLVLGGAVGNLVDRIFRSGNAVVDFVDLGWWPVFNLADVAIVCGSILLVIAGSRRPVVS